MAWHSQVHLKIASAGTALELLCPLAIATVTVGMRGMACFQAHASSFTKHSSFKDLV